MVILLSALVVGMFNILRTQYLRLDVDYTFRSNIERLLSGYYEIIGRCS